MLTGSTHGMDNEFESGASSVLAQAESRASIPPLEVTLDDIEHSDMDISTSQNQANSNEAVAIDEKNKRRAKKKAKEEREQEIRAAEERQLEKDVPRTADEFEKLVRTSPNSSFVWIKYMAFMLNSADIEKARAIAERALRTINIREENEKLNIWVGYFNLENQYGNPPERTEQHKLADELLEKMTKKFKHSCKVWLRRVQMLLMQQQDGVQSVVNRALLCLPRHNHSGVSLIWVFLKMGKNQGYKAMQRAKVGSTSAGPEEIDDGMVDGSFHSPEWHAARMASLKTSHTVTWEEFKKKQKEDELRKGELEADKDRMMREYRAQLDAERAHKLVRGRNHSSSKSSHKKDRKDKDVKKHSSKKRKRSRRRSSSSSSSSSESSSDDEERESRRSKSKSKRDKKKKHRSRNKNSSTDNEEAEGPVPLSRFFGSVKS